MARPPADGRDRDDGALRRAKAMAVPTRAAMVALLHQASAPLTAQEMAARLGVHHTAVRQHAQVLIEAGMVMAGSLPPSGRGRPRTGYRLVDEPDPYRRLSLMLASAVRDGCTAREAGRKHGAMVVPTGDAVETLRAEAERLGFKPSLEDADGDRTVLVLGGCPFADIAASDPATICALHRGLAEGVAGVVGGVDVERLEVADPHQGGCRVVLRRKRTT